MTGVAGKNIRVRFLGRRNAPAVQTDWRDVRGD